MTNPRYVVFRCDTCLRQTEVEHDPHRPDMIRCNITDSCRGKLKREGTSNAKRFLLTPPVANLRDFLPRGTVFAPATAQIVTTPINILTSREHILTLATVQREVIGSNANFFIIDPDGFKYSLETQLSSVLLPQTSMVKITLFELTSEILAFRKYVYQLTNIVQVVSGSDDSYEGKNLRFNATNNLKVYVNGIELLPDAFDRTVENQITFTPAIIDTNSVVEVLVFNDIDTIIDAAKKVELEFKPLREAVPDELTLRGQTCWGDVGRATIDAAYQLLYCIDLSFVKPNTSYGVAAIEGISTTGEARPIRESNFFLLLGQDPFSFKDKKLHSYVTGTSLISDDAVITFANSASSGELELSVDKSFLTEVFSQILPSVEIVVESTAPATAEIADTLEKRYIIGPS